MLEFCDLSIAFDIVHAVKHKRPLKDRVKVAIEEPPYLSLYSFQSMQQFYHTPYCRIFKGPPPSTHRGDRRPDAW